MASKVPLSNITSKDGRELDEVSVNGIVMSQTANDKKGHCAESFAGVAEWS